MANTHPTHHPRPMAGAPAPAAPHRLPRRGTAKGDAQARRILDGLPVPVLSLVVPREPGRQTSVVWINRAAEQVLGRSAEDLGRDPSSLWGHVHADDVEALRSWLSAPSEQPLCSTIRFITREGRLRAYEMVAQPRPDDVVETGTVIDVVLHDVSSRRDLEQAVVDRDQQLKALAEASRDVVFQLRLHPRLTVAWTNDAAPLLLGVTPTELHNDASSLFRTVVPEHRDRLKQGLQAAVGGATTVCFDVDRHGERVTVEMDLRPIRSGGQTAVLAVGRRVDGNAAAASGPTAAAAPSTPRIVTREVTSGTTPAAIVADELEAAGLARIDAGALMRQVLRDLPLTGRSVEVQLEKAPLVADVDVLRPALVAVVDNVRRHTPQGTSVRIVVARAMAGVLVSVADNGPGHQWPRGHLANAKGIADLGDATLDGGSGFAALGAAADRHTGRAAMQSLPGQGTTVRLLLHDAQPAAIPVAEPASAPVAEVAASPVAPLGHAPSFRDEPLDDLGPRIIEVDA